MKRILLFAVLLSTSSHVFASNAKTISLRFKPTIDTPSSFVKKASLLCKSISTKMSFGNNLALCANKSTVKSDVDIQVTLLKEKAEISAVIKKGDPELVGMKYKWVTPLTETMISKVLIRFGQYLKEENIHALKKYALDSALFQSQAVAKDKKGNYLLKSSGKSITYKRAEKEFLAESYTNKYGKQVKRNRHFLRAILEVGGILLTGGGVYQFMDFDEDADFEYNWEGVKQKLSLRSMRFDDNEAFYNLYGHPISGTIYYSIARSNGLSSLEGIIMAFTGSLLWEFIPEFAEVASVNDQFQTAFTAPAIGEAMFQLGEFFNRSSGTIMHKILGAIMGPSIHNWIDGHKYQRAKNLDRFGFDADYFHRFNVYIQAANEIENNRDMVQIGFDMQLNTVKDYLKEGVQSEWKWDTLFVEMASRLDLSANDKKRFLYYAKSVYAGFVKRNIFLDKEKRKNGYSMIIGPSSSYYLNDGDIAGKRDTVGLVNFLGNTLDVTLFFKDLKIRFSVDVFASFTSIRSFALEKYRTQVPDSVIKATLEGHQYSHGFGVVTNGKFEMGYKNFGLNVDAKHVTAQSISGIERNQESITDDVKLYDQRTSVDSNLYYIFPRTGINLGVGYQYNRASAVIESQQPEVGKFRATESEHIWFLKFGGQF